MPPQCFSSFNSTASLDYSVFSNQAYILLISIQAYISGQTVVIISNSNSNDNSSSNGSNSNGNSSNNSVSQSNSIRTNIGINNIVIVMTTVIFLVQCCRRWPYQYYGKPHICPSRTLSPTASTQKEVRAAVLLCVASVLRVS